MEVNSLNVSLSVFGGHSSATVRTVLLLWMFLLWLMLLRVLQGLLLLLRLILLQWVMLRGDDVALDTDNATLFQN